MEGFRALSRVRLVEISREFEIAKNPHAKLHAGDDLKAVEPVFFIFAIDESGIYEGGKAMVFGRGGKVPRRDIEKKKT